MGWLSDAFDWVGDIFGEVVDWFIDIPEPPKYDEAQKGTLVNKQSNLAQIPVVYGTRKVGGTRVFVETSGADNQYLYIALVLAEGEIQGVTEIYINDTLSSTIGGTSTHGATINATGDYAGYATFQAFHGTDAQTASSILTPAPSWTSDHKLSGVAYLAVKLTWNRDLFGSIPDITCVVKGRKCYDPRDASTVYTTNPVLCLLDYMTNSRYGKGLPSSAFESDYASWKAAADLAETNVSPYTGGTDINLFDCHAVIDTSKTLIDNVKVLLSGMQGLLIFTQGEYRLVLEKDISATYAFTQDNILSGISVNGEKKRDRFNRVIATFTNPEKNWQQDQTEYPEAGSSDYSTFLSEDSGFELETRIALDTITDVYQARNIAHTVLKKSRNGLKCSFLATIDALQVAVGDVVTITHSSLGWSSKPFRITGLTLQADGNVGVSASEHQPSVYGWSSLSAAVPTYAATTLPNPFSVVAPTGVAVASGENYQITNDNGSTAQRLYVSWSDSTDSFVDYYIVQYRVAGGTPSENAWESDVRTDSSPIYITGIKSGATYDVRVKSVNSAGVSSAWVQVDDHTVANLVGGAVAGAGVTTFSQADAPTADLEDGDIWFETDANNKIYRYNGTSWVAQSGNLVGTTVSTGLSDISTSLGSITGGAININNLFTVDSSGNVVVKNAATGARLEIKNNVIKVYDASNVVRVQIGDLS